jgi:uncharacterized protein
MRSTVVAIAAAVAFAAGAIAAGAQEAPPRRITVVGSAEVEAVPDRATITAGVETQAPTAREALAANSEAMTAVFAALEGAGVERRDMQTSQLNLNPVQEPYREGAEAPPRIVAYQASNLVTVRVREIAALGGLIDVLAEAGGNRLYGVGFEVAEPKPHLDDARERAVADARDRAELYAGAAGVTLGPVISISDATSVIGPPMMRAEARMDAAPPVAEGTVTLGAQVEIVYAIE